MKPKWHLIASSAAFQEQQIAELSRLITKLVDEKKAAVATAAKLESEPTVREAVQLLPINRVVYFIQQEGGGQRPMFNLKIGFFKNQTSSPQ